MKNIKNIRETTKEKQKGIKMPTAVNIHLLGLGRY